MGAGTLPLLKKKKWEDLGVWIRIKNTSFSQCKNYCKTTKRETFLCNWVLEKLKKEKNGYRYIKLKILMIEGTLLVGKFDTLIKKDRQNGKETSKI
ncbi:MAG: hypothetical protein CM15mP13_2410 [Pseudomonadota bacterium]|nr:MAG: hypothetical protein CM15mP13_2410 [Pseudomonadota bacterium]